MSNGNSAEASTSPSPAPSSIGNNAPKFGTLVPNRVFVGGISGNTTEQDLLELFTKYGKVKATKVISDRAGVSKGYGFVTFETEEEARKLTQEADNIMLKDRKLNIAPAIKKQVNDLGYIKPYSPRLVDGTAAATVLGTNGTVFFGNGTTYAYTNPVPVLANPSDYHQAVAGLPTPTAAHPTFPPQVPQSGAHTAAVSAATQVGGTPTAGYPAQFVYPQAMYFPQQYHQFQNAALQPQWTTSPQWRWVSPSAYAQPGSSFLSSEASTSDQSGTKGTQASPPSPLQPSSVTPNSFTSFPIHNNNNNNCAPILTNSHHHHHHSSTTPIMHSYNPHLSFSPANASASSPLHVVSSTTSVTTMTTTTTTAVIGSGSPFTSQREGRRLAEHGVLEIKPLANESGSYINPTNRIELENFKRYSFSSGQKPTGMEHCTMNQTVSSTPRHKSKRKTNLSRNINNDVDINNNSESSCCSEENSSKGISNTNAHSIIENTEDLVLKRSMVSDYRNTEYSTPSPDSSSNQSSVTPSTPSCSRSQSSSPPLREIEALPVESLSSWCPQHNPRSIPFHLWTQASVSNNSHCSSACNSTNGNVTSFQRQCGRASTSQRDSPHTNRSLDQLGSSADSKKFIGSREEALIGKPFLKMSNTAAAAAKAQIGMVPQGPLMMVPWYHYGPQMSPTWFPCPPFVTFLPPSHCSYHPSSANAHSQPHYFTPHTPPSPVEEVGLPPITVPQTPLSVPQSQACNVTPLPSNASGGRSLNSKGSSTSWWLNRTTTGVGPITRSSETCMVPIQQRGSVENYVPTSEVGGGGLSCYNPLMRGSLPFMGEPVRCFQRLTQLPDDKCALLPISPPLTPHQLEYDSKSLAILTRD